ncbi:hypothetical protein [Ilumatobacter nonamiensis]|uniref:hypothetical protein n=1 Tax=Ilumatobacter nonamiensis TaxID=467093 RepID=UPI000345F877|nr:hypothetical protein [Ilumatobacter nonamiensis]
MKPTNLAIMIVGSVLVALVVFALLMVAFDRVLFAIGPAIATAFSTAAAIYLILRDSERPEQTSDT